MQKVRFVVAASAVGIACTAAVGGGAAQASATLTPPTFQATLAGPSLAPMYPSGLIYAPTWPGTTGGAVVVADTGYNRISVFDATTCPNPDTTVCMPILQFGDPGLRPGQFNTPRDVAVDAADNIYVADAANSRIEAFSDTGTFLWRAGGLGKAATATSTCRSASAMTRPPTRCSSPTPATPRSRHTPPWAASPRPAAWGRSPPARTSGSRRRASSSRRARRAADLTVRSGLPTITTKRSRRSSARAPRRARRGTRRRTRSSATGIAAGPRQRRGQLAVQHRVQPQRADRLRADTGNERIGVFNVTNCTGTLNGQIDECAWHRQLGARCPKTSARRRPPMPATSRRCAVSPSIRQATSGRRTSGAAASMSSPPRSDVRHDRDRRRSRLPHQDSPRRMASRSAPRR